MRMKSILMATAIILAACGGGATTTTAGSTPTTTAESASSNTTVSQEAVTVNVTADDYSFDSDLTTFQVGVPYHFVVTNVGQKEHEFMIVAPIDPGTMDMEAMDDLALAVIEEDDLQPGDEASVDYTFTQDDVGQQLEFACHTEGHYEKGMHETITVTG